jgi:hypothetical protein
VTQERITELSWRDRLRAKGDISDISDFSSSGPLARDPDLVRRETLNRAGSSIDGSYITEAFLVTALEQNNAQFDVSEYLRGADADAVIASYGGPPLASTTDERGKPHGALAFGYNAVFLGAHGWSRQLAEYRNGEWLRARPFVRGYEAARVISVEPDGTAIWEFRT